METENNHLGGAIAESIKDPNRENAMEGIRQEMAGLTKAKDDAAKVHAMVTRQNEKLRNAKRNFQRGYIDEATLLEVIDGVLVVFDTWGMHP